MQFDGPLEAIEKLPTAERASESAAARLRDLSGAALAKNGNQAISEGEGQPGQEDDLGKANPEEQASALQSRSASSPGASTDTEYMPSAGQSVTNPAELISSPRWMLASSGAVERSRDDGHTWETVFVARDLYFGALSVQGAEVWVGGPAGALYHSTDSGQRWVQVVPSSDGKSLNAEIARIEFVGPQNGTLTTSAGEIWITSDSGRSWKKK
jgi:hypothetical protein